MYDIHLLCEKACRVFGVWFRLSYKMSPNPSEVSEARLPAGAALVFRYWHHNRPLEGNLAGAHYSPVAREYKLKRQEVGKAFPCRSV